MKLIKHYIAEAFKINKNTKIQKYKYFPKTKEELIKIIDRRIETEGITCDLNDIDVSKITSMQNLFSNFQTFNGDISRWDVSNVKNMSWMFRNTDFNGDISKWNVSNVEEMKYMFCLSKFNQDISKWDVSNVESMISMFARSNFNTDISNWDVSKVKHYNQIFYSCPIEEKYKPAKFK